MFLHDLLLFTGRRDPQHGGPSRFGRSALQAATGLRFHSTRTAASCGHMETAKKPICTARLPAHPAARAETARMRTQAFALSAAGRGTARGDAAWAVFEPCLPPRTRGRRFWFFCYYRAARGGGPKGCGNRDPEKYLCAARRDKAYLELIFIIAVMIYAPRAGARRRSQALPAVLNTIYAPRAGARLHRAFAAYGPFHLCAARGGKARVAACRRGGFPLYAPRDTARGDGGLSTSRCNSACPYAPRAGTAWSPPHEKLPHRRLAPRARGQRYYP